MARTSHISYQLRKVADDVTYTRSIAVEDLEEEMGVFFVAIQNSKTTGNYFSLMEDQCSASASYVPGCPTRRPFNSLDRALAGADNVLKKSCLDGFELDDI